MAGLTYWESVIHQGGRETGPAIGAVATLRVTPRWLRFLPPRVYLTVSGLDEVEAWVRGARTVAQARAVHVAMVAQYQKKAQTAELSLPGPVTA